MKIKIFCHCCEGKKTIEEKEYPSGKIIKVVCPECDGNGWVWTNGISDKYKAKLKPIYYNIKPKINNSEYDAKLKPIDDEYYIKRELIDDEYYVKQELLYNEYRAKRNFLYEEYDGKLKQLK